MFLKPKFLPNSHVLLHLQLCVRPLWSADRPEPEYQQIQSWGELETWLQHHFSSARRKNRPRYFSLQVAAAMGVMCLVTGLIYLADFFFCLTQVFILETNFSLSFIIIHYDSLLFSLSQRRKFLDDRGYWTVLPWFFHTEKAEINISALILKDYPHSTVNLRPLELSRLTKDRE